MRVLCPTSLTTCLDGDIMCLTTKPGAPSRSRLSCRRSKPFQTGMFPPGIRLEDVDLHTDLRLVLLGLPGAGKSSSGNTILGQNMFRASCGFNTVSTVSECKTVTVQGRRVTVVDTPGFSDEEKKPKKLFKEIMESVLRLTAGPHAFIIVVRLGRVNLRDTKLLQLMPKLFDECASKFTMVLFTHGDDLRGENVQDLINNNEKMKTMLEKCDQRYHVFNNKSFDPQQVRHLFTMIDDMVQASGEDQCNSQIFKLTTAEEIEKFFQELWRRWGALFCCIAQTNDGSDEELQPLTGDSDKNTDVQ
ncbi:hypothetical protein NL108_018681 [Boleophthalmus pectinirostris]|nr:hypothetical protein NL108_018681 [Boleophthalmus pectinirostris]